MISSSQLVLGSGLVFGSVFWVELVRDLYHVLAHVWEPVGRLHGWHHRVFRRDLTPVNAEIYRKAHWYNDVPEALVMLSFGLLLWGLLAALAVPTAWLGLAGCLYTLSFLGAAIARGLGLPYVDELTDLTHRPGDFTELPGDWFVNRPYHWRHHFDNQEAYYCGTFTLVDKLMGTALSLKGKRIAVTGASGTLGHALLTELHQAGAKAIALTSSQETISLTIKNQEIPLQTVPWQIGAEADLLETLKKVDILVLNHGINVHGDRTPAAIHKSYAINTFSQQRLIELFLSTVETNQDRVRKEIWVNTSEAEVSSAVSPLYELSKRALGDLVTLQRLDSPIVIRKLILGPFKSALNPVGVMSAHWVAKGIVGGARRDFRNIIVTINPFTYLLFPIKEFFVASYFKLFSHGA
ncbi:bifunctional sterol desaturase/short chain dehydrogenase [Picosynechococcus sp. PCC 11901]|uniref:bifunctional sterol desaturase/short chain dehydrogenase n=1 Tax=Picosynechococcus sp. PCC 11901 TaxID=2579791 RepID=UPI0010FC0162|nr:bifunctional sterol desaturase/short chain dehydrogenase [Picosynechococcus sp. PCC 11901]QCS48348.1 bifunctional sterol desaturase/short chain dehydrogenase [Picosynechococcus sp. PCC 11901]